MKIGRVGIVGAGAMGNGIAQTAAVVGLNVVMIDVTEAALSKGVATLISSLERLVSKGKLDADARAASLARMETSTDYQRLVDVDLVIEAATENNDLKVRILKQIEAVARPDAIIASNTSSIAITALGATLADPSRFIGMHFFNPVPMMPLVEIIRGVRTSQAVAEAIRELTVRFDKTPIGVKNSPGFVVNRILVPMINEAFFVLARRRRHPRRNRRRHEAWGQSPDRPARAGRPRWPRCRSVGAGRVPEKLRRSEVPCLPAVARTGCGRRLGRKTGHGVYSYG
ncbi:3-hydroxybutyryl-CoA dehydrogenase [Paraburkholderia sp. MM5496-R1]